MELEIDLTPLTKMLRVRVQPNLHDRLARVAALRGISASDVAREGILKHLGVEEPRLAGEAEVAK